MNLLSTDFRDPSHPVWNLLQFLTVSGVGLACLYLFYNTFEVSKDLPTAIAAALAGYVISFLKKTFADK